MSDHEAPRVFVSYAHDSAAHRLRVERFGAFLRTVVGLDVRLDAWDDHERLDWAAWAVEQLSHADFVLVIASPAYRRRAGGTAPPDVGRGAQYEAAILRDHLTRDLRGTTRRVLPVVLPGCTVEDIPAFLNAYSTTHFRVEAYTEEGVAGLLAAITGRARSPMPQRGPWRHGTAAVPDREGPRPLTGLRWHSPNTDVRAGSAWIDGTHYPDSILLRPQAATAQPRGCVDVVLDRAYRRLTAVAGVLDDATERFQVGFFRVHVDDRPGSAARAALGKPATIDIDVTGAARLRLEMYRSGTGTPAAVAGARSASLPELGWGNPTLY